MASCEGLEPAQRVDGAREHVLTIERLPQSFQAHSALSVGDGVAEWLGTALAKTDHAGSNPVPVSIGFLVARVAKVANAGDS